MSELLYIVTWNMGPAGGRWQRLRDLERLFLVEGAHAVAIQETKPWVLRRFRRRRKRTGLQHVKTFRRARRRGQGAVCVLHDNHKLRRVGRGTRRLTSYTFVGRKGAGRTITPPKWLTYKAFRLRSGRGKRITVASSHLVPSVQGKRAGAAGRRRRRKLWARHMRGIARWTRRHGLVVVGVDGNATPGFPLWRIARRAGLQLLTARSFRRRPIDYNLTRKRAWVEVVDTRALDGYSGDHKPVLTVYRIVR